MEFKYEVTVNAPGGEEADIVMRRRILPDEDYGFPYTISHAFIEEEN